MNIIYISSLLPQELLPEIYKIDKTEYTFAPQKFHHTIVEGLVQNGHQVKVISPLPTFFDKNKMITHGSVTYKLLRRGKVSVFSNLKLSLQVLREINNKDFKPDAIICDPLNITMSLGALFLKKYPKTAIITDMPNSINTFERTIKTKLASSISNKFLKRFDKYVFLTAQMDEVINSKRKPFIIMEGICDDSKTHIKSLSPIEPQTKKLLYAGGRPSKDGVNMLIEAFRKIEGNNIELNIFGEMPNNLLGFDQKDKRIRYHGKTENSIIRSEEFSSYLLLNPRPSKEEYTKYSFPSKVMEYMTTGVPMITTKLPGIPQEYFGHAYLFEEESVEGYERVLRNVLKLPYEDLRSKGEKAREWVYEKKNKIVQTKRIVDLINS